MLSEWLGHNLPAWPDPAEESAHREALPRQSETDDDSWQFRTGPFRAPVSLPTWAKTLAATPRLPDRGILR